MNLTIVISASIVVTLNTVYFIYKSYCAAKQLKLKQDHDKEQQAMIEFGERAAQIQKDLISNPAKYNYTGCQSCKDGNCDLSNKS